MFLVALAAFRRDRGISLIMGLKPKCGVHTYFHPMQIYLHFSVCLKPLFLGTRTFVLILY
jgi:hypothetical protein